MKQIDLREGARRQHRVISFYCAIQCWLYGWDGIEISRDFLERLIGIERFRQTRLEWMIRDFKEFFPYQHPDYQKFLSSFFRSVKLSRYPFEQNPRIGEFKMWEYPNEDTFTRLYEGFIPFFADYANYDERLLTSYLSLLAQGQIAPQLIPPVGEKD